MFELANRECRISWKAEPHRDMQYKGVTQPCSIGVHLPVTEK
jgi:hypothetical protein